MTSNVRRAIIIAAAAATTLIAATAGGTADTATPAVCNQVMAGPCGHADYWPHGFPPPPPASWPVAPS